MKSVKFLLIKTYFVYDIIRGVGRGGSKGLEESPFKPGFNNN